jgi:HK97 family phage portal protein
VVAQCPLEVHREADGEPIRVPVLSKYNTWIDSKGNTRWPMYTPYELWNLVATHLCSWGNAFVFKVRNGSDSIVDLRPIYPDRVKVKLDQDKNKIFEVKRVDKQGNVMPLDPDIYTTFEIMHVPGFGYDGLIGLSPIQMAMETMGTTKAADRLAAKFMGSGSMLSGVIKVKAPLKDQAQAEGIRSRWLNRHGGASQAGGVAVMDAETDFMPITIPPDQLQFLQSRRWQTTEVARMFGIPPHLVGDVEKSTSWGTGIEQQNIGFVTYTIADYTNRIEQRVTREIVDTRGQCAEFDLDRLMRGDTTERYQALNQAVGGPWMTRTEARIAEKRLPIEGHPDYDELLPPQGIGPVEDAPPAPKRNQPPDDTGNPQRSSETPGHERRDAAARAFAAEAEDYPAGAIAWMHEATWKGPVEVPTSHIDPDMHRMSKADQDHVEHFVKKLRAGDKIKPVVLVKIPSKARLQLVDGHHRYLAAIEMNEPIRAFIGTVDEDKGPWDTMHSRQYSE